MPNRVSTMDGPAIPFSKFLSSTEMSPTSTRPDFGPATRMHDERGVLEASSGWILGPS